MILDKILISAMLGSFATMLTATVFGSIAGIADVLGISGMYLLIVSGAFLCINFTPPMICFSPILIPIEACCCNILSAYFLVNSWFWTFVGTFFFIPFGSITGGIFGAISSIFTLCTPHLTVLTEWIPVLLSTIGTGCIGSIVGALVGVGTGVLNFFWAPVLGWPCLSFLIDFPMGILLGFPTGSIAGFIGSISMIMMTKKGHCI